MPRGMYAASKRCAELLLEPYADFFEIVVMRLFGVYGPGQRGMIISRLIDQVLASEEITLSGGSGVRLNPIYIDDCVAIIRRLSDIDLSEHYEVINIGGTETVDLSEIARVVGNLAGRSPRIRFSDGKVVNLIGDTGKLSRLMPGRCGVSLEEGLRKSIAAREAQP
jgi:nucleoside-diphosphate-sugar epimerase